MIELTKNQKLILRLLVASKLRNKFYWTGGTLLSHYYLGHRYSLDLDFFSEEEFSFAEVNEFVQLLKKKGNFKKISAKKIFDRWEFFLEGKEPLRIEFVHYNGQKKTLKKRKRYQGVLIDSLEDVAANKTMAYLDRNEAKDLFDLYFLIKKAGFKPKKLLVLVEKKFGLHFDEGIFWSEAFKKLKLLKEVKPLMVEKENSKRELVLKKIENYFQNGSRDYLERILK